MKVIRLKERDIYRMVERVLTEQHQSQGQVNTETLKKYDDVIKEIRELAQSVNKMMDALSNMLSKITPPDNRKPNKDEVKEYKEAINKLFKLLVRSTPVEESKYGSYRQQEIIPAIKEGMYKGSDLDKLLKVRGFEGIAYEIKGVLDHINKENVIRKQRKMPFTSPADFLLRNPDRIRGIERAIDDAERDVSKWWDNVSEKQLAPEKIPQLEPEEMTSSNPLEPPQ